MALCKEEVRTETLRSPFPFPRYPQVTHFSLKESSQLPEEEEEKVLIAMGSFCGLAS